MNMKKAYTKKLHQNIRKALIKDYRQDYYFNNQFLKSIFNTKRKVVFKFNTVVSTHSAISKEKFLKYSYNDIIKDLDKAYNKTQENQGIYNLVD